MTWALAALALFAPLLMLPAVPPDDMAQGIDVWRLAALVASAVGYTGVVARWGLHTKGTPLGIVIDWRNRVSLSRFQMVLWTLLTLPTLTVGLLDNLLRAPSIAQIAEFNIEWSLVALMGLSVASFLAAPAALSLKENAAADPGESKDAVALLSRADGVAEGEVGVQGQVTTRRTASRALLSDLMLGEETGNAGELDIARAQMLAITLVVWTVYLLQVLRQYGSYTVESWQIDALRPFSETLLTLILISHGGYITGKVLPNSAKPKERATRDLARALDLRQRLQSLRTELVSTLKADAGRLPVEVQHLELLRAQLERLLLATDPLPEQVGGGTDISATLSNLEGQLEALRRSYLGVVSEGNRPASVDEPVRELVRELKRALSDAGYPLAHVDGPWTGEDDKALEKMLADRGLRREDLDSRPYRAFEEALGLVRPSQVA